MLAVRPQAQAAAVIAVLGLLAANALCAQTETASTAAQASGSWILGGSVGAAVGGAGTAFGFGVSVGYAVFDGVVPGVRGVFLAGRGVGGEVAGTLTLTLPVAWPVLPFVMAEGGRRWDGEFQGWTYGGGAGLYLGGPSGRFGLQLGWIFRRFAIEGRDPVGASGPLVGLSLGI